MSRRTQQRSCGLTLVRYVFLFVASFLIVHIVTTCIFFSFGEVNFELLFLQHKFKPPAPVFVKTIPSIALNMLANKSNSSVQASLPILKLIKVLKIEDAPRFQYRQTFKELKNTTERPYLHFNKNSSRDVLYFEVIANLDSVRHYIYSSRNLILGIAVNTNAKNFAIFCHSFRSVSPLGEAFIFINKPVPERHKQIATKNTIHIIEFNPLTMQPKYLANYHPASLRWVMFERLLVAQNNFLARSMDKVIVVDVRDTMFQTNPFELIHNTTNVISVFGESSGLDIGSCGWNSGWVKDCFGEQVLMKIGKQPIICSGITIGSMDKMFDYISMMSSILLGESELDNSFPQCERNGVDQGVHNVLVHTNRIPGVRVRYPFNFPVINMQSSTEFVPEIESSTELKNGGNKLFSIVHQYDRLTTFQKALATKYVRWVNMSDPEAEWREEPVCANFEKELGVEIFRGICDMGSIRLLSPASCCEVCVQNRNISRIVAGLTVWKTCIGFTYVDGVCYMKSCPVSDIGKIISDFKKKKEDYLVVGATCAYLNSAALLSLQQVQQTIN